MATSGDIAVGNAKGELTITDRLKELIKTKGFQVAPAELEGVILSHPNVQVGFTTPLLLTLRMNFVTVTTTSNHVSAQVFDLSESVQICKKISAGFCEDSCTES